MPYLGEMLFTGVAFLFVFILIFGAPIVLSCIALNRVNSLREEIETIKTAVNQLIERAEIPAAPKKEPKREVPAAKPAEAVSYQAPVTQYTPPVSQKPIRESNDELEARIGGGWLNRIGIVAIIFGTAFFLKYAFDNQWIGVTGRIILGFIAGLTMIGGGEVLKKKYPIYAFGLSGGGIAILYLTTYASYALYTLIPQLFAYAVMLLITAAAILLSVRYDALPIAVLGLVGGFLTPLLLESTGGVQIELNKMIKLYTYIALLDLGILGVAYFKRWPVLNILSFFITWIYASSMVLNQGFFTNFKGIELIVALIYLTVFFLIFAITPTFTALYSSNKYGASEIVLSLANPALYFLLSYSLLLTHYSEFLGLFAAVMAALYLAFGYIVKKINPERTLSGPALVYLGIGLTFATLVIPLQLKQHWITVGWAAESVIIAWVGFKMKNARVRVSGAMILILAMVGAMTIGGYGWYDSYLPIFNKAFLASLIVIAATFTFAYLYLRNPVQEDSPDIEASNFYIVVGCILIFLTMNKEIISYFNSQRSTSAGWSYLTNIDLAEQFALSLGWTFYASVLVFVGFIKKYPLTRYMGIGLLGLTVVKVFLYDMSNLAQFYRILSFIVLGLLLLAISFIYQRQRRRLEKEKIET